MHFMPKEKFEFLKRRWEESATPENLENPDCFDQGIVPAMVGINSLEGLTTIWSCQGHPTKEKKITEGYLMIAVKDQAALDKLYLIYQNLEMTYKARRNLVRLSISSRGDITVKSEDPKKLNWYPVWILSWQVRHTDNPPVYERINKAVGAAVLGRKLCV